ncbi:hypothetical protein H0I76_06040 [Limibaculum sp. M0105]|uniref:Uncharacterized protein n=1 Tax=Thermohalobaculum xanthum TaxID=2753746 RepID=A0A8J7M592_9RHOB|nr:hypothetical protein [Thermohalobaculum xanthum]MBK0398741.1 hypothetical protein [Thermohalobaculum xanthum]
MDTGLLRLLARGYLPAATVGLYVAVAWSELLIGLLIAWLGGAVAVLVLAMLETPYPRTHSPAADYGAARRRVEASS